MKEYIFNILPAIVITLIAQVTLHEFGHFLFGKLTGWKFLYFQIHKWLIRKNMKWVELVRIDSISFQCIMYPIKTDCGALLYTAGGCILNIAGAFVGLLILLLYKTYPIVWMYAWCFFSFGIMFFTVNIIPSTKRICNDGACYKLLKEDAFTKRIHNQQLSIARELIDGKTYRQIDPSLICFPGRADNDILAYQKILEYYYWIDNEDYDRAKKTILEIDDNSAISKNVKNIICLERIYIKLLLESFEGNNKEGIQINSDIHNYVAQHETSGDVHSIRVKEIINILEILKEENMDNALNEVRNAIHKIRNRKFLYAGEVVFCINQLKNLNEKLISVIKM